MRHFAIRLLSVATFILFGCAAEEDVPAGTPDPVTTPSSQRPLLPRPAALKSVTVRNRQELTLALSSAQPGTHLLLSPGKYEGGGTFRGLHGSEKHPIVIRSSDPKKPAIFEGGPSGLHFSQVSYLVLQDLTFRNARINGLNIDDGGEPEQPTHHLVLQGLIVEEVGDRGNHDGFKLSGVQDFHILDCQIRRWGRQGSGMDLVGCRQGGIENCLLQEGDPTFANGIQMKGGSRDIVVKRCRFENAGGRAINIGGSTGLPHFRPRPEGYEAKNITVEDCTILGSMAAICFVGVDGAEVHHNTIYRPTRWGIRILQENQGPSFLPSRKGKFHHNLIAFQSREVAAMVNIGEKTEPKSFEFQQNFWYCLDQPTQTRSRVQLPTPEKEGVYGVNPQFQNPETGDLSLKPNSPGTIYGPRPVQMEENGID